MNRFSRSNDQVKNYKIFNYRPKQKAGMSIISKLSILADAFGDGGNIFSLRKLNNLLLLNIESDMLNDNVQMFK